MKLSLVLECLELKIGIETRMLNTNLVHTVEEEKEDWSKVGVLIRTSVTSTLSDRVSEDHELLLDQFLEHLRPENRV